MAENIEDYTRYQAEDFAQDDGFIQWVKHPDSRLGRFWQDWALAHPEKRGEIEKARKLVDMLQSVEREPSEAQIENLWNNIASGMKEDLPTIKPMRPDLFQSRYVWRVAAAAALVIGMFFVFWNQTETISAGFGRQRTYVLPDGSSVMLNAGSEISFQPSGWEDHREVRLTGEAFFEVTKGGSFEVMSSLGTVKVVGTSFNVYVREETFAVDCFTGKVKVDDEQGQHEQLLVPGKRVVFQANKAQHYDFDPETAPGWRTGDFVFEDAALAQVLEELQRQYDLDIDLKADISGRNYTGQFTNHDLRGALQMICLPMGLTYQLENNGKKVRIGEDQ